jgi:hypothetical protein
LILQLFGHQTNEHDAGGSGAQDEGVPVSAKGADESYDQLQAQGEHGGRRCRHRRDGVMSDQRVATSCDPRFLRKIGNFGENILQIGNLFIKLVKL